MNVDIYREANKFMDSEEGAAMREIIGLADCPASCNAFNELCQAHGGIPGTTIGDAIVAYCEHIAGQMTRGAQERAA